MLNDFKVCHTVTSLVCLFCCPFFRFTNDNEPLNSVVDKKTLKMCSSCFKKAEVFFKWDKSTVDENLFKNRQFLAKTDIQRDIWIKYINRSSVLAAHYNTQYIYVSVYILEFSSKSAHKCSFLISLKCRACWSVIPSNVTYMYVYYVYKHWYMDDLNRTDRYNDIWPIWGHHCFLSC